MRFFLQIGDMENQEFWVRRYTPIHVQLCQMIVSPGNLEWYSPRL